MIEGIFDVETADRLTDALKLWHNKAFNIVLLNLNLPDSSGVRAHFATARFSESGCHPVGDRAGSV